MPRLLLLLAAAWGAFASAGDIAAWVEREGGRVSRNDAGKITRVDLTFAWITGADLEKLSRLPQLEEIRLAHTWITDVGLEHLRPLQNVRRLDLYYAEYVSDAGIAHIKDWRRLEYLNLRGTKSFGSTLPRSPIWGWPSWRLSKLERLDLSQTPITARGVSALRKLPRLRQLKLWKAEKVDDAALEDLLALPLEFLDVEGTALSEPARRRLAARATAESAPPPPSDSPANSRN